MDILLYIFIVLVSLCALSWIGGIIYLIHPFKFLVWFYHDIMGWHKPNDSHFNDGCSMHSHCRFCHKEIMQDSQGNWFTFN